MTKKKMLETIQEIIIQAQTIRISQLVAHGMLSTRMKKCEAQCHKAWQKMLDLQADAIGDD